jgi:hypothetical protein
MSSGKRFLIFESLFFARIAAHVASPASFPADKALLGADVRRAQGS